MALGTNYRRVGEKQNIILRIRLEIYRQDSTLEAEKICEMMKGYNRKSMGKLGKMYRKLLAQR